MSDVKLKGRYCVHWTEAWCVLPLSRRSWLSRWTAHNFVGVASLPSAGQTQTTQSLACDTHTDSSRELYTCFSQLSITCPARFVCDSYLRIPEDTASIFDRGGSRKVMFDRSTLAHCFTCSVFALFKFYWPPRVHITRSSVSDSVGWKV